MKRNFVAKQVEQSASAAVTYKPFAFSTFKAKMVQLILIDVKMRAARKLLRDAAPKMSHAEKVEVDEAMVRALAKALHIPAIRASKNAVYSKLTFDRALYPQAVNSLEYMRSILNGKSKAKNEASYTDAKASAVEYLTKRFHTEAQLRAVFNAALRALSKQ